MSSSFLAPAVLWDEKVPAKRREMIKGRITTSFMISVQMIIEAKNRKREVNLEDMNK